MQKIYQLAKLKAYELVKIFEKTRLQKLTIPRLYVQIGKVTYGCAAAEKRDMFKSQFKRLDYLSEQIKRIESAAADRPSGKTFFDKIINGNARVAEIAKQAWLQLKLNGEFSILGKEAFTQLGKYASTPDLILQLVDKLARIEALELELHNLSSATLSGFSESDGTTSKSPLKLGLAVALFGLVALGIATYLGEESSSSTATAVRDEKSDNGESSESSELSSWEEQALWDSLGRNGNQMTPSPRR